MRRYGVYVCLRCGGEIDHIRIVCIFIILLQTQEYECAVPASRPVEFLCTIVYDIFLLFR